jgi:hypothetical protein
MKLDLQDFRMITRYSEKLRINKNNRSSKNVYFHRIVGAILFQVLIPTG